MNTYFMLVRASCSYFVNSSYYSTSDTLAPAGEAGTAEPLLTSYSDYYPFGMQMPGRKSSSDYRYGFQGQEKDDELKGEGNSLAFKYRIHDPRLGRFLSVDPLSSEYPWNSTYAFAENKVVQFAELEGLEVGYLQPDGTYVLPNEFGTNGYQGSISPMEQQAVIEIQGENLAKQKADADRIKAIQQSQTFIKQANPISKEKANRLKNQARVDKFVQTGQQLYPFSFGSPGTSLGTGFTSNFYSGIEAAPGVILPEIAVARYGGTLSRFVSVAGNNSKFRSAIGTLTEFNSLEAAGVNAFGNLSSQIVINGGDITKTDLSSLAFNTAFKSPFTSSLGSAFELRANGKSNTIFGSKSFGDFALDFGVNAGLNTFNGKVFDGLQSSTFTKLSPTLSLTLPSLVNSTTNTIGLGLGQFNK